MKPFFALFMIGRALALQAAPHDEPIVLSERRDQGRIFVMAKNTDIRLPRWIQVSLERPDNVTSDRGFSLRAVLQPGESRELAMISIADRGRNASYALSSSQGFGNPDAVPDMSVAYLLPYGHGRKQSVGQGYLGSVTHQGLYALDFDLPEGTTITAVCDGTVVTVKDDSDMGGASPAYARLGNVIEVLHADGVWSSYAHLKQRGAMVRVGDRVRAGDPLGLSGQTGQASGPHLHFSVHKARWDGVPETFATQFAIDSRTNAYLEEGKYYYGWHPGKPAFERVDASKIDEAALERQVRAASGGKIRFREERIDNRVLLFCLNPSPSKIELKVGFRQSRNAEPSKPLPMTKIVPAKSEVFLLSILMKGDSSYETSFSYRPLP